MADGCPEVDRGLGLELIKEAEGVKRSRAEAEIYVRELRAHVGNMDFWERGKKVVDSLPNGTDEAYKWLARMFPQAPSWLLAAIPVKSGMDGPRVPWNRRERKKWKRVSSLAIHLFCGKDRRFWKAEDDQSHVINVDQAENLLDDSTYAALLEVACSGKLDMLFGGPPCRTFTVLRHFVLDVPGGGPRPLRARYGPERFALEGLTDWELRKVKGDCILIFRMIFLQLLAEVEARRRKKMSPTFLMEHPGDPEEYMGDTDVDYPSLWTWPEIEFLMNLLGLKKWEFDQGPLGHPRRKPTCILSNRDPPEGLQGLRGRSIVPRDEVAEHEGGFRSAAWAAWAPSLKTLIKDILRESLGRGKAYAVLRKLDRGFLDHLRRDHVPYRRDCRACLAGYFRGHQHRRVAVPDGWTLSVDCVGPIKNGLSEFGPQVKYALIGVLVVPDIVGNLKAFFQDEGEAPEVPLDGDAFAVEGGEGDDEAGDEEDEAAGDETAKWEEIVNKEKVEGSKVLELPFMVPLPSKAAPVVLDGVTEILTKIKAMGLCVRRVHSDRGREFVNMAMKRYCSHGGLIRTTTSADDFKMNGRCEAMVGRLKSATRTMLAAAGLGSDHWSFAMRHVVARAQSDLLRQLGIKQPALPPFATKVYVKKRSWLNRYHEWEEKVIPATTLCPSGDVSRGFLVKTGENTYLTTTVAVEHVEEVSGNFAVSPEHAAEGESPKPGPRYRVTGKQRVAALETDVAIKEDEELAQKFLAQGDFGVQALEDFVCQLRLRDQLRPARPTTRMFSETSSVHVFGMFRHGGVVGVTNQMKSRPKLVRFVTLVLKKVLPPSSSYTTFSLNFNTPLAVHTDSTNDFQYPNYVVGVGDYVGGDVWVALKPGESAKHPVAWKQVGSHWIQGQLWPVYHQVASFAPSSPHFPTSWEGYRVTLAAYTVARHSHASMQDQRLLRDCGFPLPTLDESVRVQPEGRGGNSNTGRASVALKVAKVGHRGSPQADGDSQRSCRPLLRQRGSSENADFGRSDGISSLGDDEPGSFICSCKGFELDPSLCVCRSPPQQFYIGDFAEGMDESFEQDRDGESNRDSSDGNCLRALRTLGPGGDQDGPEGNGLREPEWTLENDGLSGYQVGSEVAILQEVGATPSADLQGSGLVEWRMVAADEPLRVCDQAAVEGLESLRVYLLAMDNEERAALALEVDAGEDYGAARRLRRLNLQMKQLEEALESVEVIRTDGGEFSGAWIRKVDAAEDVEDVPLHTKTCRWTWFERSWPSGFPA